MKVRILSGSQAGQIVEQGLAEAQSNIAFGFAEAVKDDVAAPAKKVAAPKKKPEDGQ